MKIFIFMAIFFVFHAENAFSECNDYDFIELNQMTEQKLIEIYEENINEKNRINQEALGKKLDSKQATELRAKINACLGYNDKISRAFKSKFPGKDLRKPPANRY